MRNSAYWIAATLLAAKSLAAQEPLTIPGPVSSGVAQRPAPATTPAQTAEPAAPLSPIDWLNAAAEEAETARQFPPEPAPVDTVTAPEVEVAALGAPEPTVLGLVPAEVAGLPEDLWQGSEAEDVARLLRETELTSAAMTSLAHRLLRAETQPPGNGDRAVWLKARADRLMDLGAVAEARALIEQLPDETPASFQIWAELALLDGEADVACERWREAPWLSNDLVLQIYCKARLEDWSGAATTLAAAEGLALVPEETLDLLWRYLDPALAEELPPLSLPPVPDALTFRLLEAIGEPPATGTLPRAFAVTQLSGDAGWKAQIEAAERLTRSGALAPEAWIAIVMERAPAASGGVWDRVAAMQALVRALTRAQPEAVEAATWDAIGLLAPEGLAVALAEALEPRLPDAASLRLLGPRYAEAAATYPETRPASDLVAAIGESGTPPPLTQGRYTDAVAIAFALPGAPPEVTQLLSENRRGEAILRAMQLVADGAAGDDTALTRGLRMLRALGLEDEARRTALELVILGNLE